MAKAQNPDVIEIGSSSVEELSRDDESPSKIMLLSTTSIVLDQVENVHRYEVYSSIVNCKRGSI